MTNGIAIYYVPDAAHGDRKNYAVRHLLDRLLASIGEYAPHVPVAVWVDGEHEGEQQPTMTRSLAAACERSGLADVHRRLTSVDDADGTRWCLACGLKQAVIRDSPFDRTLYLDTDCLLMRSIDPIFDVAADVAMAACHPPHSYQHQAGVIYVRRNQCTDWFLAHWLRLWRAHRPLVGDNTVARPAVTAARARGMSFRELAWDEWNVRPHNIGHVARPQQTRILHHRGLDRAEFFARHPEARDQA